MLRSALPSLITLALVIGACDKSGQTPQPPTPDTPAEPVEPEKPDFTHADCKDWSSLDTAALPALPQSEYTATFESAWSILLDKHYDPTLGCKDWVAVRAWYGDQIAEAEDDGEAYALMNGMLGELEQSHLAIVPPGSKTRGETRSGTVAGPALVPAAARYVEGKVVVVDGTLHGLDSGIPAGAELVAIDEATIAEAIDKAGKASHDPIGEALTIRRIVGAWLTCPADATKTVRYLPPGGGEEQSADVACQEPKLEMTTFGNLTQPTTVETRLLEGTGKKKIGYLAFNIWLVPMMETIQSDLKRMRKKGMTSLIIDLRGNPGGVGFMVVPLARELLGEDVNLGIMHMREGQQEFNVTGSADAFEGEVVVLVDELSASTSEIFAQSMQDIGRVKVFGATRTPGLALPSLIEELPGGAMLQYVVADYQSPKGTSVEGSGVKPDTVVPETAADFAAGKDPVLDAAIAALSQG